MYNFVIPGNKSDLLLTSVSGEYSVNNVTGMKELASELKSMYSFATTYNSLIPYFTFRC